MTIVEGILGAVVAALIALFFAEYKQRAEIRDELKAKADELKRVVESIQAAHNNVVVGLAAIQEQVNAHEMRLKAKAFSINTK